MEKPRAASAGGGGGREEAEGEEQGEEEEDREEEEEEEPQHSVHFSRLSKSTGVIESICKGETSQVWSKFENLQHHRVSPDQWHFTAPSDCFIIP